MNNHDLLNIIGDARGAYLWEVQQYREGKPEKKIRTLRRPLLIAAVVALCLLLVGCTVAYVLSLEDMAFGEKEQSYYDGSSQTVTLLSLQGVRGTPGYQATKEWYEWLETYDTDGAVRFSDEAFSEDFGDDYYAYSLYSREMKDKLDEICARYDLELLGKMHIDPDIEAGCKALQIPGIFRPGIQQESDWGQICYYANGSFDLEGDVTLSGQPQRIVSFRCHRKNAFTELYDGIGPEGTYEEWIYTTSYGEELLMVIETGGVRGHATIYSDRGEYVFLLSIHEFDNMPLPDRAGLEAYAEAFDFTVNPQRVSAEDQSAAGERLEEAQEARAEEYDKMARSYSELGYENRIKFQLEYAVNPEQLGFAVLDLEGNGSEELLVGENGYLRAVYTTKDGGSQHMMPMSIGYLNALQLGNEKGIGMSLSVNPAYIYLCENNCLAYAYILEGGGSAYHFASVKNGELVWTDRVMYDPANPSLEDSKWRRHDENHLSHPITEEEFNRTVASYHRVALDLQPISGELLAGDSPSGIGRPPAVYDSYKDLVESRGTVGSDYGYDRSSWVYQLTDLDGDGQDELIWKEDKWIGVFTMEAGQVKQLVSGSDVQLCERNVIALTRTYLDGNRVHCYYRLVNGKAVLTDYLRYDAHRNPDNPWHKSRDNSGQDHSLTPISEAEALRIRKRYQTVDWEWEKAENYPLT